MLILVCAIAGLYVLAVVWAHHADFTDRRQAAVVPLCGLDGVFKYEVTVITGRHISAGV